MLLQILPGYEAPTVLRWVIYHFGFEIRVLDSAENVAKVANISSTYGARPFGFGTAIALRR
jgi:hypothetical protein